LLRLRTYDLAARLAIVLTLLGLGLGAGLGFGVEILRVAMLTPI